MAELAVLDAQEEDLSELEAEAEELDAEHDRSLEAIAAALALLSIRYYRGVRAAIAEAQVADRFTAADARKVIAKLPGILDESGLGDVLDRYADEAEALATRAASIYGTVGLSGSAGGASAELFRDLIQAGQKELAEEIAKRLLNQVEVGLIGAGVVGLTPGQVLDRIKQLEAAMSDKLILAAVDDSLARFYRVVVLEKGKELGLKVYLFVGPRDERNCKICRAILEDAHHGVAGAYYLDEIFDIGLTPEIGGGHPRCRHIWLGAPADYLRTLGFQFRRGDEG